MVVHAFSDEDFIVKQVGLLLVEVSKMMSSGPLGQDYDESRQKAMNAALRAAIKLDAMSPDASAKPTLKLKMPEE